MYESRTGLAVPIPDLNEKERKVNMGFNRSLFLLMRKKKTFIGVLFLSTLGVLFFMTQNLDQIPQDVIKLQQQVLNQVISNQAAAVADQEVPGQVSYMGMVISDNITFEKTRRQCQPQINIVFVKTHKAGSSTIANILMRYGYTRNLTFALPNTQFHAFGYNYISRPGFNFTNTSVIPSPSGKDYNILFNHAVYNRSAFHHLMPKNASYVTILREPFSQFVSAFYYYNLKKQLSILGGKDILEAENPIATYLHKPYKYQKNVPLFSYIRNKQSQDLGMTSNEYFSPEKFSNYILDMDNDFALVMIMEKFDESLLLLKRKLCWDMKDILYFTQNQNKRKPDARFTEEDHRIHQKMAHLDYKLYSHYLKIFTERIEKEGPDFFQELAYFKNILHQIKHNCEIGASFYTAETRWHDAFEVTSADCSMMLTKELSFLDKLYEKMGVVEHVKGSWRVKKVFPGAQKFHS